MIIKYINEGIYFRKDCWDEMEWVSDRSIYLLKSNGEIEKVLDTEAVENKEILNIIDNWALIIDRNNDKFYKLNLKTKENIEIKGLTNTIKIHQVLFCGCTDVLLG